MIRKKFYEKKVLLRRRPRNSRWTIYFSYCLKMLMLLIGVVMMGFVFQLALHLSASTITQLFGRILGRSQPPPVKLDLADVILMGAERAFVVDPACLQCIVEGIICSLPIQVAAIQPKVAYNDTSSLQNKRYSIDYWIEGNPTKNYWLFRSVKPNQHSKAVKKFQTKSVMLQFGEAPMKLEIPLDMPTFMTHWKNGRFAKCEPFLVRNATETAARRIPTSFVANMSDFADHLITFNVTPFIFGGTLLGWYRECDLIPHTGDVDFAMFFEQHSTSLLDNLINSQKFVLKWILGRSEDSLELTLWMDDYKIDLFYVYYNSTRKVSFTSGMRIGSETRQRLIWVYPRIHEICAVELLGHIFHAPCNYEEVIRADYGQLEWLIDFPTSHFSYDRSHKNHESMEHFSIDEWTKVRRMFYPRVKETPTKFIE